MSCESLMQPFSSPCDQRVQSHIYSQAPDELCLHACSTTRMYYGGEPPAWTVTPNIPPEAYYRAEKKPDTAAAPGEITALQIQHSSFQPMRKPYVVHCMLVGREEARPFETRHIRSDTHSHSKRHPTVSDGVILGPSSLVSSMSS